MERQIQFLMLGVLLAYIALAGLWYVIPYSFANDFSYSYSFVGLIIALSQIIAVILAFPIGYYVDSGFAKRISAFSISLLMASILLFKYTNPFNSIGLLVLGIANVGVYVAVVAYLFNSIHKDRIKYAGYEFFTMSIGWFAGPILAGFSYKNAGLNGLLIFSFIMSLLALILILKTFKEKIRVVNKFHPSLAALIRKEKGLVNRFPRFVTSYLLFSFIQGFMGTGIMIALPLLVFIKNADLLLAGIVYGIINIPYGIGNLIGGRYYSDSNKKMMVVASSIVAILAVIVAGILTQYNPYYIVILTVASACGSIGYMGLMGFIVDNSKNDIGEFSAINTIGGGLGGVFGSIIAGITVEVQGIEAISISFSALTVMFLLYFLIYGKDKKIR